LRHVYGTLIEDHEKLYIPQNGFRF
jgi:hypothetical protein